MSFHHSRIFNIILRLHVIRSSIHNNGNIVIYVYTIQYYFSKLSVYNNFIFNYITNFQVYSSIISLWSVIKQQQREIENSIICINLNLY